jgi:hypothetical protein
MACSVLNSMFSICRYDRLPASDVAVAFCKIDDTAVNQHAFRADREWRVVPTNYGLPAFKAKRRDNPVNRRDLANPTGQASNSSMVVHSGKWPGAKGRGAVRWAERTMVALP